MNICVLTENYGEGYTGAMTSTYMLINKWINKGLNVYVLTTNIVGPINKQAKIKVFKNMNSLFQFVKCHDFKNFLGYSDDHFGFLFKLLKIPYIHTYHGNWPGALLHNGFINFMKGLILIPLYILTIHYANYVGSVSNHSIKFISKFNDKYVVIHNGVNLKKRYVNSFLNLKNDVRIIMVGNVDKRKFALLINVLKYIPSKLRRNIYIYVFGSVKNTSIYNILKRYGVIFLGFKTVIPYSKFDVYLSTSLMENMSIAAVEALSSGIPVITFDIGGMNEIIKSHKTGIIIPNYNIKLMSKLLIAIVEKGITFDFNNRSIIDNFDWNKSSMKYVKMFKEIGL